MEPDIRSSTKNTSQPLLMRFLQVLSGFVVRRVGTPRTHGRNSTEIRSGSKLQLRPTCTGTSQTVCGGLTSPVGTEFTLRRLLPGLRHRLAGRPLDPLGLYLVSLPLSETFENLYAELAW